LEYGGLVAILEISREFEAAFFIATTIITAGSRPEKFVP
jgi:hypothetical protein